MRTITAALLLLLAQQALAAMSLDKIIVYLDDSPNARDDILVANPDKETLYLQTEIYRVDNPGLPNEERVRVVDPKEFKLLVSPSKAVLAPGEQKRFRIMSLERNLPQEKVYRVTFKPVVGDIEASRTALKILVAYQALIFVQPRDGSYKLTAEKQDGKWMLKNGGNVNVEVVEVLHCQSEEDCRPLAFKGRLYAGAAQPVEEDIAGGYLELLARGREAERIQLPL
ncbi:fimbria/pilus periplasmic chaperone [Microbulbifer thermotolerans]|uniref:Fimbria/pilus periplasmic chaperone n=1 Tax=Microbulbifer thermotolerans TaxID=252514 RepID=A0AB35HZ36_MICTH|nr:fimbria/pilus periplasmic chaperone [Microbulbifer thermotolerans]MCX2780139.1 fimbria/pilus periplasmic chaperone [Microbulbifer thermotolerans]MCX2802166.1 fimbria/pilus periplasmic chaperone [Microbulbifer thermotolerans]MCX2805563.1 fimbria/pilus periplasmic chaperone [Microbulbifer thermotolerans]MCX2831909.1 fimbria/pilus periplasmic chaperone [Microbulbifer thermotolerans]